MLGAAPRPADTRSSELQSRLLDAKTALALRNDVVEGVVIIEPALKAVHNATHASPTEKYHSSPRSPYASQGRRAANHQSRDLLTDIHRRELANAEATKQHLAMQEAISDLAGVELEGQRIGDRNNSTAAELLRLARSTNHPTVAATEGARFTSGIVGLEQQLMVSRKKWRIMKGVASAIVAGSGIDWARDERLRRIVLDSMDE